MPHGGSVLPAYRLGLLLELCDGGVGLLQLSIGLLSLLPDRSQLPFDQVVLLRFLGAGHLSLGTQPNPTDGGKDEAGRMEGWRDGLMGAGNGT